MTGLSFVIWVKAKLSRRKAQQCRLDFGPHLTCGFSCWVENRRSPASRPGQLLTKETLGSISAGHTADQTIPKVRAHRVGS
jgi:hypothetical protein